MRQLRLLALAPLVAWLAPGEAEAARLQVDLTLELTQVFEGPGAGDLAGYASPGDLVGVHFEIDGDAPPTSTEGSTFAQWRLGTDAIVASDGTRSYTPILEPPPFGLPLVTFFFEVWDGHESEPSLCDPNTCVPGEGPLDRFELATGQSLRSSDGVYLDFTVRLSEDGADATLIEGLAPIQALPLPPPPGVISEGWFFLYHESAFIAGELALTSFAVQVPEPAQGLLLAAAAWLAACRRR